MGSRKTRKGVKKVYAAAAAWVERALKADDSLFTPGAPIWTASNLDQLRERFLDRLGYGDGSLSMCCCPAILSDQIESEYVRGVS